MQRRCEWTTRVRENLSFSWVEGTFVCFLFVARLSTFELPKRIAADLLEVANECLLPKDVRTDDLEWYRIAFAGFRARGAFVIRGFVVIVMDDPFAIL